MLTKKEIKAYIKVQEKLNKKLYELSNYLYTCKEDGGVSEILELEEKYPELKSNNYDSPTLNEIANTLYLISERCHENIVNVKTLLEEIK